MKNLSKSKTGGRPNIFADKDVLKCLMTAGTNSTDIAKIIKVHRSMVARWIKEYGLEFFYNNLKMIMT